MTAPSNPTVTDLLAPLADVDDRGVHFEDSFVSWRDHIQAGAELAAALRARLDPGRPPHVGVLLRQHPVLLGACWSRPALPGMVPVGLNPIRRGAALARDVAHADCQLVLADSASAASSTGSSYIDVESPQWAAEVGGAPRRAGDVRRPPTPTTCSC